MKRVGYLADKVFTRENVRAAWDAYNKNRPVRLRKAFDQRRADVILQAARRSFCVFSAHSFCVFSAHPTKRLYLSLMSRKGWLMAINKHFSPVFKLPNGGYLWQAR